VAAVELGLTGKRAAVAAASAGLGYASAKALVEEGAVVAICGRDRQRINSAAESIGAGCIPMVHDVATPHGAGEFIAAASQVLGGVDILVANGGGPPAGNYASTPFERYQAALDQCLLSVVAMCQAAIPGMQSRQWGRVVAITSLAVRQPMPELILSNTARAGVTGFLKTVAREVAGHGITVNSVQPGLHATDRITQLYGSSLDAASLGVPSGQIGRPRDFGAVIAFLCSDQARYITGAQLHVDGGSYSGLQ
jgi:3-oxoacyl-[acyl-carrier protein] reductase